MKVGRLASNDLILDAPNIADLQFVIGVRGDRLILHNRAPETAIALNGKRAPERCLLKEQDLISLAGIELEVIDPKKDLEAAVALGTEWSLKANSVGWSGRVFPLKDTAIVGRSTECDIHLAVAHLSRRHAQLQVANGLLYVKDLGSANGTFLNGKRITEARVRRGDELRFDTLSFGVLGPVDELDKTTIRHHPPVPAPRPPASVQSPSRRRSVELPKKAPEPLESSVPSVSRPLVSNRRALWLVPAALLLALSLLIKPLFGG